MIDVAVVGLGPAGRALAHRLLSAGASVLAIDPHPERVWPQTLAGWRRQLPDWLGPEVVRSVARPVLRATSTHQLADEYAVLDNHLLHRSLGLDGARIEQRLLAADEWSALGDRAARVIDCRGASPAGARRAVPLQTAHGIVVPTAAARGILQGADAVLMDWTPYDGAPAWRSRPSFLYAIALSAQTHLLEETCLAGAPPVPVGALRERLSVRLARHRVEVPDTAPVERVSIPMLSAAVPGPTGIRFGAAGAQLNPITGYSVFASLRDTDALVAAVLAGDAAGAPQRPDPLAVAALRALLQLSPAGTVALFDSFGRLPIAHQRSIFGGRGADLAKALLAQWRGMDARGRMALIRASSLGALPRTRGTTGPGRRFVPRR